MNDRTVLITGASGFIAAHAAARFARSGWTVVGTDVRAGAFPWGRFEPCDLLDSRRLTDFVRSVQPDVVVHLGAETRVAGLKWDDYAVNVAGVRNLVSAIKSSESCRRVVWASTRLICPVYDVAKSDWDYRPPNDYGRSKVEGERIARSVDFDVEWVIVRPTGIWGPGFKSPSYRDFFIQVQRGRYVHVRGVDTLRTFGYVGNTVYQIEQIVEAAPGLVHGRVFYLGDYQPLRVRQWAEMIAAGFCIGRIREVPRCVLVAAARVGDVVRKCGFTDFPIESSRYRNMTADSIYDLSALRAIAPSLPYSLEEATDLTVRWLVSGESKDPAGTAF